MIVGVVLAELAALAGGFALGFPYLGVAVGAGLVYLIFAYRYPGFAWLLVWLAVPFSVEVLVPGGNALYLPSEPMIALALLAWIARLKVGERLQIPPSRLHAPLLVLAGLTLLSILLGGYVGIGMKALVVAAGYVAFSYLYCCLNQSDSSRADRWIPWVVGSAALWGLYGVFHVAAGGINFRSAYAAGRPFFTEHGAYAAYLAMIFPLALLLTLARRNRAQVFYAVCSLFIGLGIVFSLTRAAWVSLAIVIPPMVGLWSWRHRSLKPIAWMGGLTALTFVALAGFGAGDLVTRHAESVAETTDPSNLERLNRWMAALEMARDRPWFGVGFTAYKFEYAHYRRKTIITELAYQRMSSHSEPMRLLAETGIPGFLAACWFIGAALALGLRVFRRSSDPNARILSLALIAALGTYVIHSVFRTYIDLEKLHVPFWATLGLLGALGLRLDASEGTKGRSVSQVVVSR